MTQFLKKAKFEKKYVAKHSYFNILIPDFKFAKMDEYPFIVNVLSETQREKYSMTYQLNIAYSLLIPYYLEYVKNQSVTYFQKILSGKIEYLKQRVDTSEYLTSIYETEYFKKSKTENLCNVNDSNALELPVIPFDVVFKEIICKNFSTEEYVLNGQWQIFLMLSKVYTKNLFPVYYNIIISSGLYERLYLRNFKCVINRTLVVMCDITFLNVHRSSPKKFPRISKLDKIGDIISHPFSSALSISVVNQFRTSTWIDPSAFIDTKERSSGCESYAWDSFNLIKSYLDISKIEIPLHNPLILLYNGSQKFYPLKLAREKTFQIFLLTNPNIFTYRDFLDYFEVALSTKMIYRELSSYLKPLIIKRPELVFKIDLAKFDVMEITIVYKGSNRTLTEFILLNQNLLETRERIIYFEKVVLEKHSFGELIYLIIRGILKVHDENIELFYGRSGMTLNDYAVLCANFPEFNTDRKKKFLKLYSKLKSNIHKDLKVDYTNIKKKEDAVNLLEPHIYNYWKKDLTSKFYNYWKKYPNSEDIRITVDEYILLTLSEIPHGNLNRLLLSIFKIEKDLFCMDG